MVYAVKSCEEIIDRLIRRTRMTDATYIDDMFAWLGEYVGNLRLKNYTKPNYKCLKVQNHIAKLPCGTTFIDALTYCGARLRYGASRVDPRIRNLKFTKKQIDSYFKTNTENPGYLNNEQSYLLIRGDDLSATYDTGSSSEYYITYPNHIQTSFEQGDVHLFYQEIPLDINGFALIPDEENVINGAIWYIYAMLALTGYKHNDPKMDYEYCEGKYLRFLSKGKRKIKMPSEDKLETLLNVSVNLIPPTMYYEQYFINAEQRKFVDK